MMNTLAIFSKNSNHSKFAANQQQDTLKYLKENLINKKEKFSHQKLGGILKRLNLSVRSYSVYFERGVNGPLKQITLYFVPNAEVSRNLHELKHLAVLNITFDNSVSKAEAMDLYIKSKGQWLEEDKSFYEKLFVKNITGQQ